MFIRRKIKEKIFLSVFILLAISLAGINITVYFLSAFPGTKAASSIALTSKYNSSDNSVSLEWSAAGDEPNNYGYRIIRSAWEAPEYPDTRGGDQVEPVGPDKTSYIWTGVPRGMIYYFRICQLVDTLTCVYSNSEKIDTGASSLSVGFIDPVKDAIVGGNVNVEARASFPATKAYFYLSPKGTTSVGFYRDDSYDLQDSYYYFNFAIDSQKYDDGKYVLTAVAYKTDSQKTTTTLDIEIDNNVEVVEPALLNISLIFKDLPSNISEAATIYVESSVQADVYFSVYEGNSLIIPPSIGQDLGNGLYGYLFDANYYNDGEYTVKAMAIKDGYNEGAAAATIVVAKAQEQITPAVIEPEIISIIPVAEEPEPEKEIVLNILAPDNGVLAGEETMQIELNGPVDSVKFAIIGSKSQEYAGEKNADNSYSFIWPTTEFADGKYKLIARAYQDDEVVAQEYADLEIKNNQEPEEEQEEIIEDVLLPICEENEIFTAKECREYILLPLECRAQGLADLSSCNNYLGLDQACRQRNMDKDECDEYLSLPLPCREADILEPEACTVFINNDRTAPSSSTPAEPEGVEIMASKTMLSEYTVFSGVIIIVAFAVFVFLFILMKNR